MVTTSMVLFTNCKVLLLLLLQYFLVF